MGKEEIKICNSERERGTGKLPLTVKACADREGVLIKDISTDKKRPPALNEIQRKEHLHLTGSYVRQSIKSYFLWK